MDADNYSKPIFAIIIAVLVMSVGWLSYFYLGGGQVAFPNTIDDDTDTSTGDTTVPSTANMAPDFSYTTVNGGTVSLSGLRGKVVILDFMATWCQPCKNQISNLKTIYSEYSGQGVEIVSLNVDLQASNQELLKYRNEQGASWDFVTDSDGVSMDPKYSVTSIPTIVIVNKDGSIAKRNVGLMSTDALRTALEPLL